MSGMDEIERTERRELVDHARRQLVEDPANGITPDPRTQARWDLDDLHRTIERAGVPLSQWPYARDTADGIEAALAYAQELARMQRLTPDDWRTWRLDRERRLWSEDARNPARSGPAEVPGHRDRAVALVARAMVDGLEVPTQEAVAADMDLDVRTLRKRQGPRGWHGILADARVLASELAHEDEDRP